MLITIISERLSRSFWNRYYHASESTESSRGLEFRRVRQFHGVNLAAFWQFFVISVPRRERRIFQDAVLPLFGFRFCVWIWWRLERTPMIIGAIWPAVGLVLAGILTRGFRTRPAVIDFTDS